MWLLKPICFICFNIYLAQKKQLIVDFYLTGLSLIFHQHVKQTFPFMFKVVIEEGSDGLIGCNQLVVKQQELSSVLFSSGVNSEPIKVGPVHVRLCTLMSFFVALSPPLLVYKWTFLKLGWYHSYRQVVFLLDGSSAHKSVTVHTQSQSLVRICVQESSQCSVFSPCEYLCPASLNQIYFFYHPPLGCWRLLRHTKRFPSACICLVQRAAPLLFLKIAPRAALTPAPFSTSPLRAACCRGLQSSERCSRRLCCDLCCRGFHRNETRGWQKALRCARRRWRRHRPLTVTAAAPPSTSGTRYVWYF